MEIQANESINEVMALLETEPQPIETDHRENLAILAASGQCKEMIGVELTQDQIKRLSKKDVEKYFKRYEASLSSKTCGAIVETFLQASAKALCFFLPLDQEKFLSGLKNDFIVNRELNLIAGSLYLKYGKYMAAASASLLAANSLKLEEANKVSARSEEVKRSEEPVKEPVKEIEEELEKELEKNL